MKSNFSYSPMRAALLFMSLSLGTPALASDYSLDYDTWARPRSAAAVMRMPAVAQLMRDWLRAPPESQLEIRYPGGAEGSLWASELRDWLVSLGLPSAQISTLSGSPRGDALIFVIRQPKE